MSVWQAIVLGIVQGLTEFLPVSSSGHLVLLPWLFGWEEPGITFNVGVHLGTLVAVLIYFRRDLFAMATALPHGVARRQPLGDPMSRLAVIILVGSIPAAIVGLSLESRIDAFFHSGGGGNLAIALTAIVLIVVGLLLLLAERVGSRKRPVSSMSLRDGLLIGAAQAAALFPGVSRSGSTITAGLFLGLQREDAARFSFLLGVPAIVGAGVLEIYRLMGEGLAPEQRVVFFAGIATSAVVGYLAIAFMLRFLQRHSTLIFIGYRVVFGALILSLLLAGFRP